MPKTGFSSALFFPQ